jgi:DNA-binding NarL/FixJ family response regulator
MTRLDKMIKPELDEYITNCNFLAEELQVFTRRAHGETIEYIAEMEALSVSTVKRILARIQAKIDRFQSRK